MVDNYNKLKSFNMKVLLVHPGKQHSFETARALKDAGILYKYVTTVYDAHGSLTNKFKCLLKGNNRKKANTRHCPYIDDCDVIQYYELWGLIVLLLSKIPFLEKLYFYMNVQLSSCFAIKAAKLAVKENVDAIIVYDGISRKGLKYIKTKASNIKTIMDVSISMRPFMKANFERDMSDYGHNGFYIEEGYLWNKKYEKIIYEELQYVDFFFAPSEIVIKSLEFCGIDRKKIIKIPYGVNPNKFNFVKKTYKKDAPLKLIYVGQISYRKGLHHLLKIISKYRLDQVSLFLAGSYDVNSSIYKKYDKIKNIEFGGFVTRDVLASKYQEADAFIFPTLGEGYGMVVLEALSTGTPVIISDLAGGNDAIVNYINGIIYDATSEKDLKASIDWFVSHKAEIPCMSEAARESVKSLTWENYHNSYAKEIIKILEL